MTLPDWQTTGPRIVETRVYVNGTRTGHESVTWGQNLVSSLPRQVEAAAGFGHRTGTIVWWRPGISRYMPSPWTDKGGVFPSPGDRVTVDALDGRGNTVRVFTGTIDSVEDDGSGVVTSKIVDHTDEFNRTARVEAITEVGIPWEDGVTRRLAPTNAWVIDEIGRQLGYYSTPPAPSGLILDAPLQGTVYVYAEKPRHANAQLVQSSARSGTRPEDRPPLWRDGGAGIALHDAHLRYTPYTGGGSGFRQLRLSVLIHPNHKGSAWVEVLKEDLHWAWVQVDETRRVIVGSTSAGGGVTRHRPFRLPASDEPIVVSVIFRDNRVSAATSTGQEAGFPLTTPLQKVDEIRVAADPNAAISGVQVSDPGASGGHVATGWTPSMRNGYGWHAHTQAVTPSIRDRNARDVLGEFSEAMLTPVWLDAKGVLQVRSTSELMAQRPALTVATTTSIASLGWGSAVSDLRDPVHVQWSQVRTSMNYNSAAHTIQLWQGSGYQSGEVGIAHEKETIEVPEDEEWPNFSINKVQAIDKVYRAVHFGSATDADRAALARFNAGEGSWIGAMTDTEQYERDATGAIVYQDGKPVMEQIDVFNGQVIGHTLNDYLFTMMSPWEFRLDVTLARANLMKVPEVKDIKKRFWGENLPILRGPGRIKRTPVTYTRENRTRRWTALTHDLGVWCTREQMAQQFGNWLYGQLTTLHPKIRNLVCRFDPRLDVGMVIRIDSRELHGINVSGLIVSVDHDPENDTTTLEVRTTAASADEFKTYTDLASAWSGAPYQDLQAMWAMVSGDYTALNNDPTRRP